MNCIIVDDDLMARTSLQMLCEQIEDLEVVRIFEDGIDVAEWLKTHDVDLILLDIEMPNLTGMDLVKTVEDLPQIIFITGHSEYAVEAFEHQVTDFVPKPVEALRLQKAIDRARELNENVKRQDQNEIYIRESGKYTRINLDDIYYIESYGDYVRIVTDIKTHILHSTLKNLNDKLRGSEFMKVHRSYIVNLSKIVDIREGNIMMKGKSIPVSRTNKQALMSRIRTV